MENAKNEKNKTDISQAKSISIPKKVESKTEKSAPKKTKTAKTAGTGKPAVKNSVKKKPTTKVKASAKKVTAKAKTIPKKKKQIKELPSLEKSSFIETVENIETGAKVVGEKASEIAGGIFQKVKKGVSAAFDAGSKIVEGIYKTSNEYIEIYKEKNEMKKLTSVRDDLLTKLGSMIYLERIVKKTALEKIFDEEHISDLFDEIERIDSDIINLGKELDKEKK